MPGRVARSNVSTVAPKYVRNKSKKRALNAYAAASRSVPERRIPQHRLGEAVDDGPRQKRQRTDDESNDEETEPQRKRAAKRLSVNNNDDMQYGSDSSGNEWMLGGLAEDDEDSDIDSDEALGESDVERFEGFTFRGSSSKGKSKVKKSKPPPRRSKDDDISLDEANEHSEDADDSEDDVGAGLGADAVDLATMLDDDDSSDILEMGDPAPGDGVEGDASDGSEEDDDEESGYESLSSGAEEDDEEELADEERTARMRDMLETLDPSTPGPKPIKVLSTGAATVGDFLEDTILESDKTLTSAKAKKSAKSAALVAPLPKRQQDRLDREEATKRAKQQLDRWRDTVVRNRRAEFLTFPLQDPADQSRTMGKEKFLSVIQQQPRNELEDSIQRIMVESGLTTGSRQQQEGIADEETALLKSEELATNKMPIDDVLQRRAELRRNRELLFREEIKAKRIAKIKSKSYRRVHRKERERLAEHERQAREDLGEDALNEDEKERNDRRRAEARMGTKHKDSKWAKSLKATNRATWDDDARDGVIEQARRTEELKKRIAGEDLSVDGRSDSDVDDEEAEDNEDASILKQLASVQNPGESNRKGLASMKFMQNAAERRRKANDEDVERLRKELAIADGDEEDEDEQIANENVGRAIFGPRSKDVTRPATKEQKLEFEVPDGSADEDDANVADQGTSKTDKPVKSDTPALKSILKSKHASGPLAKGRSTEKHDKNSVSTNGTDWLQDRGSKPKRESDWLEQRPKSQSRKTAATDDVVLDLTTTAPASPKNGLSASTSMPKVANLPTGSAGNTESWITVTHDQGSGSDAEGNEQSNPMVQDKSLMQRAFAGEDTQAIFEVEKRDLAASEDEKEISNHVPGWGAWGGAGLSKQQKKFNERIKHNPLYKTKVAGVKQADRKDAKLENVIISEKQDRKGRKYFANVLPHEFENQEQYERSRRLPMGPEWTTKEVHQRMTRPRVVVRKGVVGQALSRPIL